MDFASAIGDMLAKLDVFETLTVEGGRITHERAYKAETMDEVRVYVAERREGETLRVQRFPDGYKITFCRTLLT